MRTVRTLVPYLLTGLLLVPACRHAPEAAPAKAGEETGRTFDQLDRASFNRAAVRLNLPLFWVADADSDGAADPAEIVSLRFYPTEGEWVSGGRFTDAFVAVYDDLVAWAGEPPLAGVPAEEEQRIELVVSDLDQGRPTLVHSDLAGLPEDEKAFVRHMLKVAELIDGLYFVQNGLDTVVDRLPSDPPSRSLFRRNWGPGCVAPKTEQNPACTAIPGQKEVPVGVYPADLQAGESFCDALEAHPEAETLLNPFTVVQEAKDELVAVPLPEAWPDRMQAVAAELRAAADAIETPDEEPLRTYLRAAAKSFQTNDWRPADEAWSQMNAENSRWYVRVAPDEVYWEPCAQKAGFHLTFARINRDSLRWQEQLTPVRQEMEDVLATLVGPPYEAREVAFHLPDFIDIVVNAGDDRNPMGATIGQSLPNWGPVANEGRGRTVAMSNLYTDPDSLRIRREQAASLLGAGAMEAWTDSPEPGLLSTILHEAAHNLGPSHDYEVDGKVDTEVFGGPLSSTMEELKAQTAGLWYIDFLREKGIISDQQARESYVDSIVWAFGHVSRGMYTPEGRPKPYSQLAAIQLGFLLDQGALRFDPEAPTAGGEKGAFLVDFGKLPSAVNALMEQVGRLKGKGDRAAAQRLIDRYVDAGELPKDVIKERMLRHPKASFVYSVEL